MVVPAYYIARVLPPPFSENCNAGIATLSAIHFASARLSIIFIVRAKLNVVICGTNYRREDVGHRLDSYLRWLHIFLLIRKLDYLLVAFLVLQGYDHLHNWWGSGGNTRLYSFGDANAYDLYEPIWILPKIQAGFEGGREIVCCICWG